MNAPQKNVNRIENYSVREHFINKICASSGPINLLGGVIIEKRKYRHGFIYRCICTDSHACYGVFNPQYPYDNKDYRCWFISYDRWHARQ